MFNSTKKLDITILISDAYLQNLSMVTYIRKFESGVKTSNNLHTKFNPRDTPDYQLVLIAKNCKIKKKKSPRRKSETPCPPTRTGPTNALYGWQTHTEAHHLWTRQGRLGQSTWGDGGGMILAGDPMAPGGLTLGCNRLLFFIGERILYLVG